MNGCNSCSKRRDIRKECPWGGSYHHKGESGEYIGICNAYKQETNADHIRGMSDDDLAESRVIEIHGLAPCPLWTAMDDVKQTQYLSKNAAIKAELDWLRQPWEGE